jgi:DNA-binding response OmpR family regulator
MVVKPVKDSGNEHSPEGMFPRPRILIVDDNPIHASAVKRALRDPSSTIGRLKSEIDVVEDVTSARRYLREDSIDIYFLDLEISEKAGEGLLHASVGKDFVRDVVKTTNAGVIICSSFAAETEAAELLEVGADDYVEKTSAPDVIAARTLSVWRRTLQSRPANSQTAKFAHVGKTFALNDWRFVVGNRTVTNIDGATVKLSPTEHAFSDTFVRSTIMQSIARYSISTFSIAISTRFTSGWITSYIASAKNSAEGSS